MPNEIKEMTQEEQDVKVKAWLRGVDEGMDRMLSDKDCKYPLADIADISREMKKYLKEYDDTPEEERIVRQGKLIAELKVAIGIKRKEPEIIYSTDSEKKEKTTGPSNFFMEVEPLW